MKNNNLKIYDVIIVGGGASGLFCASVIKRNKPELKVAILEKQQTVGKKLLATGNGRCNITNIYAAKEMYNGTFSKGAGKILENFSPASLIKHLNTIGLLTTCDSEGRVYPMSKHSATLLDVLLLECRITNVEIITGAFVSDIKHSNSLYYLQTDASEYAANILVVASGSKATPETGADDSLLGILKKLGHTITKLYPSLCPVLVKSKSLFALKGVRASGAVSLIHNGNVLKRESGEIQFTEKALSGICVFNLARFANTLHESSISVALLPDMKTDEIFEFININKQRLSKDSPAENLLCGIFHRKLSCALLKESGISKERTAKSVTSADIKKLANLINDWRFEVIPSCDFKRAQVVAGGVLGSEIDADTMESKVHKNLYIIGEAIDVDGDCGGLNLHFAFASAHCAAREISK